MSTSGSKRHADDGAMVRLLDGELDHGAAEGVRAHLAECADCAERFAGFRATTDRLDELLTESARSLRRPVPPAATPERRETPPRAGVGQARSRPSAGRWRIAAALALLLAAGLVAPPVRAWVAGRVDGLIERLSAAPEVRVEAPAGAAVIRIAPSGARLLIEVVDVDPSGVLELRRGGGVEAVLELETPAPDVVVGSRRVRLEGGPAGAVYRLAVPPGVEWVVLRDAATGRTLEVPVPAEGVTRVPIAP